jgi:hypothetical protein
VIQISKHPLLFRHDSKGQATVAFVLQIAFARGTVVNANKNSEGSCPPGFIQVTNLLTKSTGHCNTAKSLVTKSGCVSSGIACPRHRTQCQLSPSLRKDFQQSVVSGSGRESRSSRSDYGSNLRVACAWHDTSVMSGPL